MLKIEDVKISDELECVDRDEFNKTHERHKSINEFKVSKVVSGGIAINDGDWVIEIKELKYFKKKEQSQYTFDDLIDVAVQANKDRVINGFYVVGEKINCQTLDGEDYNLGIGKDVLHGIKYLQSLYKETFVIECEEDIARIKIDADVTLANGLSAKCVSCQTRDIDRTVRLDCKSADDIFGIFVLKGATVTQSK